MRPIKFRGKSAKTGEWVYGYYVLANEDANFIVQMNCYGKLLKNDTHSVMAGTVGQFTGFEDKSGQKVYEGSGCVHSEYGAYYVKLGEYHTNSNDHNVGFYVQWVENRAKIDFRKDLGWWVLEAGLTFGMNIHDNPELLEKKC